MPLAAIWINLESVMGFPGGSVVKNLPVMQELQEMWVWSLVWQGPLKECMATHSSILAWRIPGTEEPGGLQFIGSQRVRHDWSDLACTHTHRVSYWVKLSQTEKEKYCDIPYMWNLKWDDTSGFKNRLTDFENEFVVAGGKNGGRDS